MPAAAQPIGTNTNSLGFSAKLVKITQIDAGNNLVLAVDQLMVQVNTPYYTQRAKGRLPQVGESWLVDQAYGRWTLSAFVGTSDEDFKFLTSEISDFASAVNELIAAAVPEPDTWHPFTVSGPFTVYDDGTGDYSVPSYRRMPDNTVLLRGMLIPTAWPNNTHQEFAVMPPEYCPAYSQIMAMATPAGFDAGLRVLKNGSIGTAGQSGSGIPGWVSLGGVRYTLDG